jgi:hypothetical protein
VIGVELEPQGIGHLHYDGVCGDFFSLAQLVDQGAECCGIEADRIEAVAAVEGQHLLHQAVERRVLFR